MKLIRATIIFTVIMILCFTLACTRKQPIEDSKTDDLNELSAHESIDDDPQPEPDNLIVDIRFATDQFTVSPNTVYSVALHGTGTIHHIDNLFASKDHLPILTSSAPSVATINPQGVISVAESAAIGSTITLHAQLDQLSAELNLLVSYSMDDTVEVLADGMAQVTNPESIAVVVNKVRSLPDGYEPDDLVKPNVPFSFTGENERRYMREEAAKALESLFQHAEKDGITVTAVSGYRTFATQRALFNHYVHTDGEERARQYSALPGTSEHQTGLAMDVSAPSIGNRISTKAGFEHTEEGKWLQEHASEHGFIIRYPKDKEHITGYVYEPWHLRYVGLELAELISEQGIALEEFFQTSIPVMSNTSPIEQAADIP